MSYIATSGGNKRLAQALPANRYRAARPKIPQVGLHTTEFPAGHRLVSLWQFLDTRTTHGSYNAGSDSYGTSNQYAPWSWYTWHAPAINPWAAGIAGNCRANEWDKISKTARDNLVNGMALQAHRYSRWCVSQGLGPVPARMITSTQARNGVYGFVYHGSLQADRTDPGGPRNIFPRDQFLAEFVRLEAVGTTPATVIPAADKAKPNTSSKPWAPGRGPWPTSYLTVRSQHNAYTHKAWVKLLQDVGYKGTLPQMVQQHLKAKGYYKGSITPQSQIGPQTVTALQRFLADRGHYKGRIDGSRGPQTVQAEIRFLNWNAEQYWK